MKGTTTDTPLAETLRDLHFDRKSGTLVVSAPADATPAKRTDQLSIDRGEIFYCRSDAPTQRLDQVLVRWGLCEAESVGEVLRRAGRDVRGGLVAEGVFPDAATFDDFMGRVLRERTLETLALDPASYEMKEEDVSHLRSVPFPTSTPNLILEAARRLPRDEAVLTPLREATSPLSPNAAPPIRLEKLHLSPQEGYVLGLVNGSSACAEIAQVSPLGEAETVRLLFGLLLLDVLHHPATAGYRFSIGAFARKRDATAKKEEEEKARIRTEYERVKSRDVFHLLPDEGDDAHLDPAEQLRRYRDRWTPDKFSPSVAKEMREHLLLIASRAGEALLAGVGSKRKGDAFAEGDDQYQFKRMELSKTDAQAREEDLQRRAEEACKRGLQALAKKDYHSAVQLLRDAVRMHETARHHAALAEALSHNPHWLHRAEESYRRAMQLAQFDTNIPLALGRLYARTGHVEKARQQFERVLEMAKGHEEATAELAALKKKH